MHGACQHQGLKLARVNHTLDFGPEDCVKLQGSSRRDTPLMQVLVARVGSGHGADPGFCSG